MSITCNAIKKKLKLLHREKDIIQNIISQ